MLIHAASPSEESLRLSDYFCCSPSTPTSCSPTSSSLPASTRHASMPLSLRHLYSYTLSVRQMLAPPTTIPLRLSLFLHTVAPEWLCDPPLLNFQNPPPTCCLSERLTPFSILLLRPPHYQAPVSLLQRSGGVCTDGSHSHANLSPLPAPQPSLLNPFSDIATPEHHHGLVYF